MYSNDARKLKWAGRPRRRDGRAILRVDGKLYERQLVRIQERELVSAVLAERSRKYGNSLGALQELVAAGDFWLFELRPGGQL